MALKRWPLQISMLDWLTLMRVFYYAPDTQTPSWGVGMLYCHVRLLRAHGIRAFVLHQKPGFRARWLKIKAPRAYRQRGSFEMHARDILVVPEIFAAQRDILRLAARRIVFVQASSYISPGLGSARDYRQLGYAGAIATMPHIRDIVEKHYGVPAPVVPPCIAPYFFLQGAARIRPRARHVVLHRKDGCRDFPIIRQMLRDHASPLGWRVIEVERRPHCDVARILRRAAFHVNVNCHESFNAMVPESMAAGCIPICYEAFGGRDYLSDGANAYVFPTHQAFPLVERTLELMRSYEEMQSELQRVRFGGLETAKQYTEPRTEDALLGYFENVLA